MPIYTTPESRFANLPDYPFKPNYVTINGLRMHYVDEGVGDPILCLHGEPSWSYLYRKMIPILQTEGRVIAPDLIGFGKSDKFTRLDEYSYKLHLEAVKGFIEVLDLQNITMVVQDWGGLLGLPLAFDLQSERVARVVVMNTLLPIGKRKPSPFFKLWTAFARYSPIFTAGLVLQFATATRLSRDVIAAYNAPFPTRASLAGARIFPTLVPNHPDKEGVAYTGPARKKMRQWNKPAQIIFAPADPVLGKASGFFSKRLPTAGEPILIEGASHFLQEDKGEEIAEHIVRFIRS